MTRDYDAVVIGSGVAGVTAAYELNAAAGGAAPGPPPPPGAPAHHPPAPAKEHAA